MSPALYATPVGGRRASPWPRILWALVGLAAVLWAWAALVLATAGESAGDARPWTLPLLVLDEDLSPRLIGHLRDTGILVALVLLAVAGLTCASSSGRSALGSAFGDARFARASELAGLGLRARHGVVLGRMAGRYLVYSGQTHVLVTAPTGAGKGVGLVVPNLLAWPGSAVVLDVKGENFAATAGYRAQCGQRVVNFAPLSDRSHRFNPFDAVARADAARRVTRLDAMALTLLPDPDRGDRVWAQQGRALFVGLSLVLLDAPDRDATLGNVLRHLQTEAPTTEVCRALIHRYRDMLDPVAVRNLANFAHLEPKIAESVKLGLVGALTLWNNPLVDAATSATDFPIDRLRAEPTTLYIGAALSDMDALAPLLRLFIAEVFVAQLRAEPGPDEPHQVLMLLDEFDTLGAIPSVAERLPFVRSFGVRMMLIIQGLSQLDLRYQVAGREKILQACAHQLFFALNDRATTDYVAYRLGQRTVRRVSRSVASGRTTRNVSEAARPLLMPQEIAQLPRDTEILLGEGQRPVRARKIAYYRDRKLRRRAHRPLPSVPNLKPRRHASPAIPRTPEESRSRVRGTQTGRPYPSHRSGGDPRQGELDLDTRRDIDAMVADLEGILWPSAQ